MCWVTEYCIICIYQITNQEAPIPKGDFCKLNPSVITQQTTIDRYALQNTLYNFPPLHYQSNSLKTT